VRHTGLAALSDTFAAVIARQTSQNFLCLVAPGNAERLIMLEIAVVVAVTVTVMALLYRWLEPKT
jgi:hypothetical protein